jgi:hypothetical protein
MSAEFWKGNMANPTPPATTTATALIRYIESFSVQPVHSHMKADF